MKRTLPTRFFVILFAWILVILYSLTVTSCAPTGKCHPTFNGKKMVGY